VSASPPIATGSRCLLTLNGGSSSIKFAVYSLDESLSRGLHGQIDRIGLEGTRLTFQDPVCDQQESRQIAPADFSSSIQFLVHWLDDRQVFDSVKAVGHRVVHGLTHPEPAPVTTALLDELKRFSSFAPDHLPPELALIEALRDRLPGVPQLACFDTAFHHSMPRVARLLPIPRRYEAMGLERYGFHGLSYSYLMEELERLGDPTATKGRVILAHLGNGASLAAVGDGRSLDTSMGFTPASGLVMGTRSGDLDPGLIAYLAGRENITAETFNRMITRESGLLGISETSSDMRDLLERETSDGRSAEAVALFCYQVKKWIGSFAAVLDGLDTLVFSGGIGENAAPVRSRICNGLGFLGVGLDEARNSESDGVISKDGSAVTVRVIRTDEEQMIARSTSRFLNSLSAVNSIES
jgi:acetate kinase